MVGKDTCNFSILEFVKACFLTCLEDVPWEFEKNVFFGAVGWNITCKSVRAIWYIVLSRPTVFFCQFSPGWPIQCWKYNIEVYYYCSLMSLFSSVNICFIYLGFLSVWCIYIENCYVLLMNWPLYHSVVNFFVLSLILTESLLYSMLSVATHLFWVPYSWISFSIIPSLSVFLKLKWVSYRQHNDGSCFVFVFVFNPVSHSVSFY